MNREIIKDRIRDVRDHAKPMVERDLALRPALLLVADVAEMLITIDDRLDAIEARLEELE